MSPSADTVAGATAEGASVGALAGGFALGPVGAAVGAGAGAIVGAAVAGCALIEIDGQYVPFSAEGITKARLAMDEASQDVC